MVVVEGFVVGFLVGFVVLTVEVGFGVGRGDGFVLDVLCVGFAAGFGVGFTDDGLVGLEVEEVLGRFVVALVVVEDNDNDGASEMTVVLV